MARSIEERIAELEAKESAIKAQKKQLKARLSAEARKARTKQLIQEGAIMEAAIGMHLSPEDLENWQKYCINQKDWIIRALKLKKQG